MSAWLLPMLAMLATQALLALTLFAIPVVAPQAGPDLGVDPGLLGLYTAVAFAVSIPATLSSGAVIRRWGAVRTSQACLLLGAACALLSATGILPLFVLGGLALGMAFGPETPASAHLLTRVTPPDRRPLVFSLRQTGNQFGGIAAGFAVPTLVLAFGWRESLLFVGLLAAALAAALLPLSRRYDDDRQPGAPLAMGSLRKALDLVMAVPDLRRLALASFWFSGLQLCLNGFLVSHAVTTLGYALPLAGMLLGVAQAGGLVGRIGWGVVAQRWFSTRSVLAGLALTMSTASATLALVSPDWPEAAVIALCAVFGLSASGWNGIYVAEVARLAPPGRAGEATGGMLAVAYSGLVLCPAGFSAIVAAGFGYEAGYLVMAVGTLLGAAALLHPARKEAPCA